MNRETDTVFLQTIGRFITAQVQLATAPLLQKIETLEAQIATLEKPTNGKDGLNGKDGKDGKDGAAGSNGADVVGAFRDSDRHLILTLSNGVTKDIGLIHGQDGKDGVAGKDGRDGIAYDQVSFVQDEDDPRQVNVIHAGVNGSHIGSFRIPGFIDKGIWRQGNYKTGDSVSVGGSMFIAQTDTDAKPETNKDWRLSVKHGRDGKDGKDGPQGERGPSGHNGRDLTQLGADGSKWR